MSLLIKTSSITFAFYLYSVILSTASALPQSVWDVHIDRDPAPAPQDGPPLSVGAIRDKAYLPSQIGAIFGAYVVAVIIVSIAILTLGRRLRGSAKTSPKTLGIEIVNNHAQQSTPSAKDKEFGQSTVSIVKSNHYDPSPVSPAKKSSYWPSPVMGSQGWGSMRKHKHQESIQSSTMSFDESVVEEDRAKNEIEMDRLYAAVADHETEREDSDG